MPQSSVQAIDHEAYNVYLNLAVIVLHQDSTVTYFQGFRLIALSLHHSHVLETIG